MNNSEILIIIAAVCATYELIKFAMLVLKRLKGNKCNESGKPIIRHCRNCEWSKSCFRVEAVRCNVKYRSIYDDYGRIEAIFCKHFKRATGSSTEEVQANEKQVI